MSREPRRDGEWTGFGTAWSIIALLLTGIAVWGAIGYGLDRWLGTGKLFLAIGLVAGAGSGIYLIYIKYGKDDGAT